MVRHEQLNRMTHEFLAPIAKQPLNLSVDKHHHARMIGDHDRVRSCLQQLAEPPLGLAQQLALSPKPEIRRRQ